MTEKLGRSPLLAGTLALSAAGFFLRRHHLATGFDAAGLPTGRGIAVLAVLCVLAVCFFAAAALTAKKRPAFRENFPASAPAAVLMVLAAGLLAAGCATELMEASPLMTRGQLLLGRITGALGIITGLCFVAMAATWNKGKKPGAAPWLLPLVYYIVQMIFSFKSWSTDPIVLDYCFKLFSLLCVMLGALDAAGFVFDAGSRRRTIFFCLCGVFFSCVTLADGGISHMMRTGGSALFLLATLWQLLGKAPAEEQAQ